MKELPGISKIEWDDITIEVERMELGKIVDIPFSDLTEEFQKKYKRFNPENIKDFSDYGVRIIPLKSMRYPIVVNSISSKYIMGY
jgi:hypothetical protein